MNALTIQGPSEPIPVAQSETAAVLNMIERVARDPAVDIDKLHRLFDLRAQIETAREERGFDIAMAAAQSEMTAIAPDKYNTQTKSRYASYHAMDKALRPIYTRHGFSLSFNTGEGAPENCVRVLCRVSHGGCSRNYRFDMPADGKGAKGGDVMTKTHAAGAAAAYGARYLLKMIFNVAIGEDDDDGNGADKGSTINDDQLAELQKLIVATKANVDLFCKSMKIECIPDMPTTKYEHAITLLKEKARRQAERGKS